MQRQKVEVPFMFCGEEASRSILTPLDMLKGGLANSRIKYITVIVHQGGTAVVSNLPLATVDMAKIKIVTSARC